MTFSEKLEGLRKFVESRVSVADSRPSEMSANILALAGLIVELADHLGVSKVTEPKIDKTP